MDHFFIVVRPGRVQMEKIISRWMHTWKKALTAVESGPAASTSNCRKISTGHSCVTTWQHCVVKNTNLRASFECCITTSGGSGAGGRGVASADGGAVTSQRAHVLPSRLSVFCVSESCAVAGKRPLDSVQTTSLSEAEDEVAKNTVPLLYSAECTA